MALGLAAERELAGEVGDAARVALGDHLDGVDAAFGSIELATQYPAVEMERSERRERSFEAEVEVLEILAHDDVVDTVGTGERTAEALHIAAGADVGVGLLAPAQIRRSRWSCR